MFIVYHFIFSFYFQLTIENIVHIFICLHVYLLTLFTHLLANTEFQIFFSFPTSQNHSVSFTLSSPTYQLS
jgi:hypothetical protein